MSLFCKGTKRLPRNFRIRASQAYRRRRLHSTCRWPAIGHGCWRLGHRSYERVCTLGHGYLGLHVEGIMPEALRDWGAGIGHWRRWRGIRGLTSPSAVYCAASGAANFAACGQLRGLRRVTKLARFPRVPAEPYEPGAATMCDPSVVHGVGCDQTALWIVLGFRIADSSLFAPSWWPLGHHDGAWSARLVV